MRYLILTTLGLLLVGCGTVNAIHHLHPNIVVSPTNLDFGDVIVQYDSTLPIEIENVGDDDLNISDITFDGTPSGAFALDTSDGVVPPGETLAVNVTFTPPTYLPYTETVLIDSDDPDEPQAVVRLFGNGVDGSKPDIAVDQLSMDFESVDVGTTSPAKILTITNEGQGNLVFGSLMLDGDAFAIAGDVNLDGLTLTGGGTTSLPITYTPSDIGGDHGTLTIPSNDPDEDPVTVQLIGDGGGDYGFPVAISSCPTDVSTLETLWFNGNSSYDPNGFEPLLYSWTLTQRPAGSASVIQGASTALSQLVVDLAGDYTAQLVVTNTVGISSDPFICSFTAVPSDQIHVELSWNTDNSDLDLHLVRSGSSIFEDPGDCNFCNQTPNWGSLLDTSDDPSLALDDMYGYGPENININVPVDDTYTVYVHYYKDNGGGATTATVNVYLGGVEVDKISALMSGSDLWEVGTISWASGAGTFAESDAAIAKATRSVCY